MTPRFVVSSALHCLIAGAALAGAPAQSQEVSLYARLGGATRVAVIVDQAISRSMPANRAQLKESLEARICALAGGGCTVSGGVDLDETFLAVFVADLRSAMRAANVPLAARNELLELLVPPPRDVASL